MNNYSESNASLIEKLRSRIKGSLYQLIGIVLGGIAGFLYYKLIGCSKGSCPITSNPWLSAIWGAFMGYLISGIFNSKTK